MKKYILSAFIFAAVLFSCSNPNDSTHKNTDTVSSGNTDSAGSQPVQTGSGAANAGNATDTITRNGDQPVRTDSVVRH
jgi:hypothetical protein